MPTFSRPRRMEKPKPFEPIRYFNPALDALAAAIRSKATDAMLVRERGGTARGVWWCEMSGRLEDGAWVEMRLHVHRSGKVQAGMLLYQPLTRGGRTLPLGSVEREGDGSAKLALTLVPDILKWIESIVPKKKEKRS